MAAPLRAVPFLKSQVCLVTYCGCELYLLPINSCQSSSLPMTVQLITPPSMTQIQSPTSQLAIISLSPAVQPSHANHLTTHHYPCTHPLSIYSSTPSPLSHYPPIQSPPTHRHPSHFSTIDHITQTLAAVHPHNHPPSSKGSPLSLTVHSPSTALNCLHLLFTIPQAATLSLSSPPTSSHLFPNCCFLLHWVLMRTS